MAPPNGSSSGGRKTLSTKQPLKPVVPALPLPSVQRKAAAKAASRDQHAVVATAVPATQASPTTSETSWSKRAAGGRVTAAAAESNVSSTNNNLQVKTESTPAQGDSSSADPDTNGSVLAAAPGTAEPQSLPVDKPTETPANHVANTMNGTAREQAPAAVEQAIEHTKPEPVSEAASKSNVVVPSKKDPTQKQAEHNPIKAAKGRPPSVVSPSRYQMPPPFQPANRPYNMMNNSDMARGPPRNSLPNGPAHVHHSHPSNSSAHFGTFQDSQSSSPAPPHSGGVVPPPPAMPTASDGRPAYMGPTGNGFPPMMHYGADMIQAASFDSYGRPTMGYGPMEAYPPYGNNFGPSTPHSFHDSQSSGHPEDSGIYHPYPPNGHRNGGIGPGGDMDGHVHNQQGRMFGPPEFSRMMPNHGPPPHMASHDDNADGLIGFIQQQFGVPDLADCTLELRYTDDRAAPVRIPGHRFMFARSSVLAEQLRKQTLQVTSDRALYTLLLASGNKWLRSDSFYMAVQRLYGLPLLPMPPRGRSESVDVTDAGTSTEQLDFALSYAAAGQLLHWTPVLRRGCEVATQLLSWQTMEKVLDFALEGFVDNGFQESHLYAEGSKVILNALVTFIVHNLPPSFNLDTTAEDPKHYARLPECPPPPPAASRPAPVIARGSSVQLGKGRRSQQITGIQFGDLSLSEESNGPELDTPKAAQQAQPVPHAVLSRVLINLPFAQLKMILESAGSGNVNGWANAEPRYRIIRSAVEEREARRLRTLDAVLRGRVANSEHVRTALRNPSPQDMGRWSTLGWQEEILPYGNADGPSLGRKWVPYVEPQHNAAAAEYP